MAKAHAVEAYGVVKRCRRCGVVKDTSEFHGNGLRKDGLQSYCRDCKRVIDGEHNRRNPRRNYGRTREYARRNMIWLHEYLLTKQCEWPGCDVGDPDILVFDHLNPGDKRGHVSAMVHSSWGLKSIQEEVAKCRVLCANHHQKHMIRRFGYKNWLTKVETQKKSPHG